MTVLNIWTVYEHPKDYPNNYVVRRWSGDKPTDDVDVFLSLQHARDYIKFHTPADVCIGRSPNDDPCILECWI